MDLSKHPCFDDRARHLFGRVHLPVAPQCNVSCNYCDRKSDCPNENRPGLSSAVLTPKQAFAYAQQVVQEDARISVVGIAGPGDPFATPELTLETLRLVRSRFPEMLLCVASNGLNLAPYAGELAELEVGHVTITINAIDPEIASRVYRWVRPSSGLLRGLDGARMMIQRQLEALRALVEHGVTVKVNTIIVPGVNDEHAVAVAEKVAALGASVLNALPLKPVPGTPFGEYPEPGEGQMRALRARAADFLPQMAHCTRCRADAVGMLGESMSKRRLALLENAARPTPVEEKTYIAVASMEGVFVNQHLGESTELFIFQRCDDGCRLVERRETPPAGGGAERWGALGHLLSDCRALVAASVGEAPRRALEAAGLGVFESQGLVDDVLDAVYRGDRVPGPRRVGKGGDLCAGAGRGCG